MNWKDLAKTLAGVGLPILANAVAPGSGTIIALVANALGLGANATPDEIASAVNANPDNIVKLKALQDKHEEILAKAGYDAEVAVIQSVNLTLQTEAQGGSWLQKNHHAVESLLVVNLVVAVYFVLPLLRIAVPVIPEFAYMMLGAVLGVTAWQRGQANVVTAKNQGNRQ
jgi:hypothetical protein